LGKVIVKIKRSNQAGLVLREMGLSKRKPRSVDAGATWLYLTPDVVKALGLKAVEEIESKTSNGVCRPKV